MSTLPGAEQPTPLQHWTHVTPDQVLFGSFFVLNLLLAVLESNYNEQEEKMKEEAEARKKEAAERKAELKGQHHYHTKIISNW